MCYRIAITKTFVLTEPIPRYEMNDVIPVTEAEMVLRLAVARMQAKYKPGWLYYQCKEKNLLEQFKFFESMGYFEILERGKEDPSLPPRLTIELVPKSCWFDNVRSHVSREEWTNLKKRTAQNAKYRCEICGGRGKKWPVECHEIWDYDDSTQIQRLTGLIALCPPCHKVKHIGFAEVNGQGVETTAHLAIVNGWSYRDAQAYVACSFGMWQARSAKEWKLDISWLGVSDSSFAHDTLAEPKKSFFQRMAAMVFGNRCSS